MSEARPGGAHRRMPAHSHPATSGRTRDASVIPACGDRYTRWSRGPPVGLGSDARSVLRRGPIAIHEQPRRVGCDEIEPERTASQLVACAPFAPDSVGCLSSQRFSTRENPASCARRETRRGLNHQSAGRVVYPTRCGLCPTAHRPPRGPRKRVRARTPHTQVDRWSVAGPRGEAHHVGAVKDDRCSNEVVTRKGIQPLPSPE